MKPLTIPSLLSTAATLLAVSCVFATPAWASNERPPIEVSDSAQYYDVLDLGNGCTVEVYAQALYSFTPSDQAEQSPHTTERGVAYTAAACDHDPSSPRLVAEVDVADYGVALTGEKISTDDRQVTAALNDPAIATASQVVGIEPQTRHASLGDTVVWKFRLDGDIDGTKGSLCLYAQATVGQEITFDPPYPCSGPDGMGAALLARDYLVATTS